LKNKVNFVWAAVPQGASLERHWDTGFIINEQRFQVVLLLIQNSGASDA